MGKKMELTKNFWVVWILMVLVLVILIAIGFGIFANREDKLIINEENGGNVFLNYSSNDASYKIEKANPLADAVGMKKSENGDYYDFSVDVELDNSASVEYDLAIVKDKKMSSIADDDIRIYLEQEDSGTYVSVLDPVKYEALKTDNEYGTKAGSMVLVHVKKAKNTTDHYRLRMWASDQSTVVDGFYQVEIVVNGIAN